jgi:hypothetical protein
MLSDVSLKLADHRFDATGGRAPAPPAALCPPLYLLRLGVVRPRNQKPLLLAFMAQETGSHMERQRLNIFSIQ